MGVQVEPGVGLQSGDALALLMVLLIEAQQSGANGNEDITPQIVARCEQVIACVTMAAGALVVVVVYNLHC